MKQLLLIFLMVTSFSANAETTSCIDAETNGQIIRLFINWTTNKVNINERTLNIEGDTRNGAGIITNMYENQNFVAKKYIIFQNENMLGSSETWVMQVSLDEKMNLVLPEPSTVKRVICSKSFIKPFLKQKYS